MPHIRKHFIKEDVNGSINDDFSGFHRRVPDGVFDVVLNRRTFSDGGSGRCRSSLLNHRCVFYIVFQFPQNPVGLAIHEPSVFINKSLVTFPFRKKLIIGNDIYDIIFPNPMFSHTTAPFFICFCNRTGSHSQHRPSGHRHSAGNPFS